MGSNDLEKLMFDKPYMCSKCGGELEYLGLGEYQCVNCGNQMLDDYGKIKRYLSVHGPAPAIQISRGTGISRKKIDILLQRGMAEPAMSGGLGAVCEKCGTRIGAGRYCVRCSGSFQENGKEMGMERNHNGLGRHDGFGNYMKKGRS